ncbi:MAG: AAA family ATPase [Candidatus Micrarchaeia archaeon]
MIDSIELENWKVHKHTKMQFRKGVNVLIGVMGAGKSTILDAISFGLFGTFPALAHRRVSTDDIISRYPVEEKEAIVKVEFGDGNDIYTVTRKITRDSATTARLEKNGVFIQAQPARVNEEIGHILKMDYETFSRVIYAEQNRLDYFMELAKGDRKKQIDQMLGLYNFAKAEDNATSLLNYLKMIASEDEKNIAGFDIKKLKSDIEALTAEKGKYIEEQNTLQKELEIVSNEAKKISAEIMAAKDANEKRARLTNEINELNGKLATYKNELSKIKSNRPAEAIATDIEFNSKLVERLNSELKTLRDEERRLVKKLSDEESKGKQIDQSSKEKESIMKMLEKRSIETIEKEYASISESVDSARKSIAAAKSTLEENEKWAKELEKHISACPVCNRDLTDEMRIALLNQKNEIIKNSNSRIAALEEELQKALVKRQEIEQELRKAKINADKLRTYDGVEEQKKMVEENISKLSIMLADMQKTINGKNQEIDESNKKSADLTAELNDAKRLDRYKKGIEETNKLIEAKSAELASIKVDEKRLYELQDILITIKSQISGKQAKVESNKKYLDNIDSQLNEKTGALQRANEISERMEKREQAILEIGKFKSALVETEGNLRTDLVRSINSMMESLWPELYPYEDYVSIRLKAESDDYSLEAALYNKKGDNTWVDVNSIASGGERSVASLAMRIALAMVVVPNLKWLILDEPTHNIDESGISKLIDVLGNSMPKIVDQIFVITHDSSLKNISFAKIYQIDRNKSENGPASIIEIS